MLLHYKFIPSLVEAVWYVTHKGKRRGFSHTSSAHQPKAHEMIYLDYGSLALILGEKEFHIKPGECIFIPGGVEHSFIGEKGAPFDYLNIMFVGDPPRSLFGKCLPVNRKCLELMEKLKQESVQETPYCKEIIACVLTELISRFVRQVEFSTPIISLDTNNRHPHHSEIVNRALKIISDEYSNPLSLKQLSQASGIGESRLTKLLKTETGDNFSSLLHKQRVTAAKHLISEDTFSMDEISNAVGYQSLSFFFKIFKRLTGMTPKAYLRSLGEPTEHE